MVFGGAHLEGVIQVAIERGYAYNFRLASLLLLGLLLVFGGGLCLTAVRGLARGRRRAWERGLIGAVLLIVVATPMTPLGGQGVLAGGIVLFAAASLITLVLALRQLEAHELRHPYPEEAALGGGNASDRHATVAATPTRTANKLTNSD
jgi:hypothetical protein